MLNKLYYRHRYHLTGISLSFCQHPDTTWCRCVGSTTPRCVPLSKRSSRCYARTCILPSRRSPSSTVRRTSRQRAKTLTWTWKTWRAYRWTRHPIPRGNSVWTGMRPRPWAWGAVTRSTTSHSHTWTGARQTDEYWPCHGPALPNITKPIPRKHVSAIDLNIFLFFCHFI